MGVLEIQCRGIDLRLIGLDRPLVLLDQGTLCIELLLGDRVLGDQLLKALQSQSGIRQQRLVAAQGSSDLLEGRVVGPRVYLRQEVPLMHELAFLEGDLLQLPADLRLDGHCGERCDRPQGRNADLNIAGRHDGDGDRDRIVQSSPAAARTLHCGRMPVLDASHQQDGEHEDDRNEKQRDFALARGSPALAQCAGYLAFPFP